MNRVVRAGLGIFAFIGLCLGFVFLVLFPTEPLYWSLAWGFAAAAFITTLLLNRRRVKEVLLERRTRYGANLALIAFLVLGIATFVSYLTIRYRYRTDISFTRLNSLSKQSLSVIQQIQRPMRLYYFDRPGEAQEAVKRLLELYDFSSTNLSFELIDPNLFPARTRAFGVTNFGTLVVALEDGSGRKITVNGVSEEKVTNALIRALKGESQKIYFVQGHGERGFSDPEDASSITFARDELTREGFTVRELNLALVNSIPEDAAMLLLLGSQSEFTTAELAVLQAYLADGGKALIALDLSIRDKGFSRGTNQLRALLQKFGLDVADALVVDTSSQMVNQEAQVIPGIVASATHPVVRDFPQTALEGRKVVNFYFPLATHLFPYEKKQPDFKLTPLVVTTPTAWAESSWQEVLEGKVQFNEGEDRRGDLNLAFAIEKRNAPEGLRMIVSGTSIFAVNAWLHKVKNRDFLLNSVNWLGNQEGFIAIRPPVRNDTQLNLDARWLQVVFLLIVLALPISILGTGLWVWSQRRNL